MKPGNPTAEYFNLSVPDLDEAIAYFIEKLGFRLEMIIPADRPAEAKLSGQGVGIRMRLNRESEKITDPSAWHRGRAGMEYRDLVPDRYSGRIVASHIRIPDGGPLADYVHFHKIRFQMLYCRRGWVRVAYELQGEPILMAEGDCVLQPPEIRHRVLECSAGLEVIEIGSPAIHETWVDHDTPLTGSPIERHRLFKGQQFLHHTHQDAVWESRQGAFRKDLGVSAASLGAGDACVWRAATEALLQVDSASGATFLFALNGSATIRIQERTRKFPEGEGLLVTEGQRAEIIALEPLELLEVAIPEATLTETPETVALTNVP